MVYIPFIFSFLSLYFSKNSRKGSNIYRAEQISETELYTNIIYFL